MDIEHQEHKDKPTQPIQSVANNQMMREQMTQLSMAIGSVLTGLVSIYLCVKTIQAHRQMERGV